MSKKLTINKVAEVLKKNEMQPDVLRRIIEELNLLTDTDEEEKPPAIRKQFVVVVSDPEGKLPIDDFVAWVVQIPESESPATIEDRVFRAAYDYNTTKKGRLLPVQTVGEALESVPAKAFKECEVWVKTKHPVLVVRTRNEIPKTDSILSDRDRGIDPNRVIAVRNFKKLAEGSGATVTITPGAVANAIDRMDRVAPG